MSNVEPIKPGVMTKEREVDDDTVELLEDMLAMAKAGEISGFAGAILYFDGVAAVRRAGYSGYALMGALMAALHRMQAERPAS